MGLSVNNSVSALNALSVRQSVTANNIANSESKEFKKSVAILEEDANGAVSVTTQKINTPGTMTQQPDGTLEELSNVDIVQEVTDMIPTKHAYEANLQALKTTAEMEDSVLDLLG